MDSTGAPAIRRPLKIAVLGSTYARFPEDNQVPWLRETVNLLARRGHEMTVIAPSFEGLKNHEIDGVPVLRFRYAPRKVEHLTHDQGAPNKLRNPFYQLLGFTYILMGTIFCVYWARRKRFDVIHVHWPFPHGILALAAGWASGAKVVAMCHGAELAMARRKGWVRHALRFCLLKADLLACNSSHTGAEIKKLCGRDAMVIPYGPTVQSQPAPEEDLPPNDPAVILFSGRLIQRKGIPYLLKALPLILKEMPVKLLITGDGDRRQEWEALAGSLGLCGNVEFLGFVSAERLAQLYRDCDVYVLPAIFDDRGDTEGLGVVLIEALKNECPVVASAVGGIVDVIIHEETGLLVPEKDEHALAAAILRLLNDRALAARLGEAGRLHAERHFDWDRVADKTEALLREAVEPGVESETHPKVKRPLWLAAKVLIAAAVAACVAGAIRHYGQEWNAQAARLTVDPALIAGALALAVAYRLLNSWGWVLTLRAVRCTMGLLEGARLWLVAETMRWLPGSVWNYVSRVHSARAAGLDPVRVSLSVSLELLLTLAAWMITAAGAVLASGMTRQLGGFVHLSRLPLAAAIAAGAAILCVAGFRILSRADLMARMPAKARAVAGDLQALFRRPPRADYCIATLLLYLGLCILNGVNFWLVLRAISPVPPPCGAVIGINAIGWLLGFFAFMAPSGVGVREAALAGMLTLFCPLPEAIAGAILWRILQVASELLCLSICLLPSAQIRRSQSVTTILPMNSLNIIPTPADPAPAGIIRRNKPFALLAAATACVTLLICWKVILPAYQAPTNRTYTSSFGYAALKHRLKIPFEIQTAKVESRMLRRRILGEGFLSTRSLLVPVIPTDKIVAVNVVEGQTVHKGDVLAVLDSSKEEIKLHSAELALASAMAEKQRVDAGSANGLAQERPEKDQIDLSAAQKGMAVLKEELAMYQKLEAAGAIAHIQVLDMEKAVSDGEADLNRGQFDLQMSSKGQPQSEVIAANAVDDCRNLLKQEQLAMADYKIVAPADGIIQRVLINAGEYNQDTGKPAFVLASGLWFEAHFDQTSIGLIEPGARAEVFLEAAPGIRIAGKVNHVVPVVSYSMDSQLSPPTRPTTGGALEWPATYKLSIDLDAKGMQLVPGLTGFARVNVEHQALAVPRSAILSMSAGSGIVHVVNGTQQEARAITYGMTDGDWTEVTSGLAAGDKVISEGQLGLEAGDRIIEVNALASDKQ